MPSRTLYVASWFYNRHLLIIVHQIVKSIQSTNGEDKMNIEALCRKCLNIGGFGSQMMITIQICARIAFLVSDTLSSKVD